MQLLRLVSFTPYEKLRSTPNRRIIKGQIYIYIYIYIYNVYIYIYIYIWLVLNLRAFSSVAIRLSFKPLEPIG